jgi:hypothetical protein
VYILPIERESTMFSAEAAHADLVARIAAIQPRDVGTRHTGYMATPDELEDAGAYIECICKAVADHVEAVLANASASINAGSIDEKDARFISDAGSDLAGDLFKAAEAMEAA